MAFLLYVEVCWGDRAWNHRQELALLCAAYACLGGSTDEGCYIQRTSLTDNKSGQFWEAPLFAVGRREA